MDNRQTTYLTKLGEKKSFYTVSKFLEIDQICERWKLDATRTFKNHSKNITSKIISQPVVDNLLNIHLHCLYDLARIIDTFCWYSLLLKEWGVSQSWFQYLKFQSFEKCFSKTSLQMCRTLLVIYYVDEFSISPKISMANQINHAVIMLHCCRNTKNGTRRINIVNAFLHKTAWVQADRRQIIATLSISIPSWHIRSK